MTDELRNWKIAGFIATLIIVLSIPLYVIKETSLDRQNDNPGTEHTAIFVGREKCITCHKKEHDAWKDSHHDNAMDIANENTVLGNFNNAEFVHKGITSHFYKKDKKFYVNTQGSDGRMYDFQIAYTFGVTPLQQYLIPFEGGRLQCLPIAWNTQEKKWYHLYPNEKIKPTDWLHWTRQGQNWNSMCSECHSTNLKKKYDLKTEAYNTTWSEIDVSCEACHGPGSLHVEWADLPELARPDINNDALVVRTYNMDAKELAELCARCHSRRSMFSDYRHDCQDMMDNIVPELIRETLYFPDGQIQDEVYVYGSFVQSKMYSKNVKCSDCHDIHSLKLVKNGNTLCLTCHRADMYDTKNHHFHKKKGEKGDPVKSTTGKVISEVGEGAECIKCHMPGKYYMGPDYRHDHSIRIPRPDLSITLKTPNACNQCHRNKNNQWSVDHITKWYGINRRPHYGTILAEGRKGTPEVQNDLVNLAGDQLFPVIVRATALLLLSSYPYEVKSPAFNKALASEDALIRHTAVRHYNPPDPKEKINQLIPILYDPVRAVRMEAAMSLTSVPRNNFNPDQKEAFQTALLEYENAMEYSSDFSFSGLNLGNMYVNLGQPEKAENAYKRAIKIAEEFYPAKINLAMLYNKLGKNSKAEELLRDVAETEPDSFDTLYSLGLLLAEEKKYKEAIIFLEKAAKGLPKRARIHYNLGLLLQFLKKDSKAEAALLKALDMEPDNMDFLYATADHYIKRGKHDKAKKIAETIIEKFPESTLGQNLLKYINSQ